MWVMEAVTPIEYRGRRATLGYSLDITEQKRAEEALLELDRIKSEFIARASHELRTPLFSIHQSLGAKLVDFHGFEMPLLYSGILEEHRWVRSRAGLFDVSHMGEIAIRGSGALDLVSHVTANDPSDLAEWQIQYSLLLNHR